MKSRLGAILFLLFTAVSLPLLIIALKQFNILSPKASDATPQFVTATNLTDTGVSIAWTTPSTATVTNLQWGDSTLLGTTATDYRDTRDKTTASRTTHFVSLTGLKASTTYYYRITALNVTYPATTEQPYSFKTLPSPTNTAKTSVTIYGDATAVSHSNGLLLVYIKGPQGFLQYSPLSAVLNADNTWAIPLGAARDEEGKFLSLGKNASLAILYFSEGNGAVAIHTPNDSPLSLNAASPLTQTEVDRALSVSVATTDTPTPTSSIRQDVPLSKPGTITNTPVPTSSGSSNQISKAQLLSMFSSPSLSNISDSSASIMYLTSELQAGTLQYGSTALLGSSMLDDSDISTQSNRRIHHFTVTGLSAASRYYFKATLDSTTRTFSTPAKIAYPSGQTIIVGSISNGEGECLVRSQIVRGNLTSSVITTVPSGVTWTVNIAPVRTSSLDAFMVPGPTDTLIANGFCISPQGNAFYGSTSSSVQNGVTSGVTLQMSAIQ